MTLFYFLCLSPTDQVGRKYSTGEQIVTIRKEVIDAMSLWTTHPFSGDTKIDEKIIRLLLICCVPESELKTGEVKDDVKLFISGKSKS